MTTTATTPATGLQTKALLVSLVITGWSGRKHDKKITREVAETHNAKEDAGRYNKNLVAKKYLDPLTSKAGEIREFHRENTLPWGKNGEYILPSANYFDYVRKMQIFRSEYEKLAIDFYAKYPEMIEEARIEMNGLFNIADYPRPGELKNKFTFTLEFMPLPEVDFRLELNDTEINLLKQEAENAFRDRTQAAVADIWTRIKEQLTRMKDRLTTTTKDKEGNDKPAVFRDSLFNNLSDLIDLIPKLNVTGSPDIAQICDEMKGLLIDPDKVRESATIRNRKAEEVNTLLNKFEAFF